MVKDTTEVLICSNSDFTLAIDAFSSVTSLSRLMKEAFITETTDAFSCSRRVVTLVKEALTMELVTSIDAFSAEKEVFARETTDAFSWASLVFIPLKEVLTIEFVSDTEPFNCVKLLSRVVIEALNPDTVAKDAFNPSTLLSRPVREAFS